MVNDSQDPPARRRELFESHFAVCLAGKFGMAARPADFDLVSPDGRRVVELKASLVGGRDLNAAVLQLATLLAKNENIDRAYLVASIGNMSGQRLDEEWDSMMAALRPDVASRLAMVGITSDMILSLPRQEDPDPELDFICDCAGQQYLKAKRERTRSQVWTPKTFDVWSVLLDARMRGEGPVSIKEIARRSGCTYPTIADVLDRLHRYREITRASNRSASFQRIPTRSLGEVVTLMDSLRPTIRFFDESGRPPDVARLIRRIVQAAPKGAALGGVIAARHHHPAFDLHGTPRVDLTVHGERDLTWVSKVDPALQPVPDDTKTPILVVHWLARPDARFVPGTTDDLPVADPVETLLDLFDMRLTEQAGAFLRFAMRPR